MPLPTASKPKVVEQLFEKNGNVYCRFGKPGAAALSSRRKGPKSRFSTISGAALVVLSTVFATSTGLPGAALAQDSQKQMQGSMKGDVKSTYGAWSLVCDTPPGAKNEQCALMQNVVAEDRQEVGLSVVILRTADRKSELLRVLAPLGVLLPSGLGLNVDGKSIGNAYFVRCFQDGCYAEVVLNDKLVDTLKSGKTATFIIFQTPEEGIGIPVDLNGFTDAYKAIP